MRNVLSSTGNTLRVWAVLGLMASVLAAPLSRAAVGGGGPDIIPSFTQNLGGGSDPVTVTFDPSTTYLPVPDSTAQEYTYQAFWDFGDGNSTLVGAAGGTTAAGVLAPVSHTFGGEAIYVVNLRINILVYNLDPVTHQRLPVSDPSRVANGPQAFTTGQVHVASANFPPTANLVAISSPATGALPYELQVNPSTTFDEDGFVMWAAIDWGDGTAENVRPTPPAIPNVPMRHVYTSPGIYRVTLSVVDNGRVKLGVALPSVPDPRDPQAALAAITIVQQTAAVQDASLLNPKYNPQLSQNYILVQIPGNMVVLKGQFLVDFRRSGEDRFDCVLQSHLFADNLANASVVFTLGGGAAPVTLPAFKTDARGRYQNSATGFLFDFNARKQLLRIKFTHAQLRTAFGLLNSTAVNTNVDVPIKVVINNALMLGATARFTYNATAGSKGIGKNARSYPNGN